MEHTIRVQVFWHSLTGDDPDPETYFLSIEEAVTLIDIVLSKTNRPTSHVILHSIEVAPLTELRLDQYFEWAER